MQRGMEKAGNEYFEILKVNCVAVMRFSSKESVDDLNRLIQTIPDEAMVNLKEYIIFPLRSLLLKKDGANNDAVISTINCLTTIFNKVIFTEWNTFHDIFNVTVGSVMVSDERGLSVTGSEDMLMAVLTALRVLFNYSAVALWRQLFSYNNIPMLGHIVTLSIQVINREKNKTLIEQSFLLIEALFKPSYASNIDDKAKEVMALSIGETFSGLLPGIATSVFRTISDGSKVGDNTKCVSVKVLMGLIEITLSDKAMALNENLDMKKSLIKSSSPALTKLIQQRDKTWLKRMSKNLTTIFEHFIILANSESYKVRKAALITSTSILKSCFVSLEEASATLLQVPLSLLHDDYPDILKTSQLFVKDYTNMLEVESSSYVSALIQQEANSLIMKLPKVIRKAGESEKLRVLNLLAGYLELMGPKLSLLSDVYLNSLLNGLVLCFELDISAINVIEENNISAINYEGTVPEYSTKMEHWIYQKSFLNHSSKKVTQVLIKICYLLGEHSNAMGVFTLISEMYERESSCCQAVIVMNEMLQGIKSSTVNHLELFVDDLLNLYLQSNNWNLICGVSQSISNDDYTLKAMSINSISMRALKTNIALVCLHLEAVATMSTVMGASFQGKLIVALYPVLEKVLSIHNLVSVCAVKTLKSFSESCCYGSVADLINSNADHLVSIISIQLLQVIDFPQSPVVLQAMLLNSDERAFPLVSDTIEEILSAMDAHWDDTEVLFRFLKLLLTVSSSIKRWFFTPTLLKPSICATTANAATFCTEDSIKNVLTFQEDYSKSVNFDNYDAGDDEGDNFEVGNVEPEINVETPDSTEEEAVEEKPPNYITVILSVMRHCANLISHKNVTIKLKVLDVISEGVHVLSEHENSFLPFVHQLWSPLCERLNDKEMPVVICAFELVYTVSTLAKDFVRQRFVKTVLPNIIRFIDAQQQGLCTPTTESSTLKTSLAFKLLKRLLHVLGKLLVECQVPLNEYKEICFKCIPLLSSKLPLEVQEATLELFKHMITTNADFIFVVLLKECSQSVVLKKPEPSFKLVKFCPRKNISNNYAKNVNLLLELC